MNGENAEGSFNIYMPTIEESLAFTFKKWGRQHKHSKKMTKKNIGLSYI